MQRHPRRMLFVTATAAVLAAGGAGVAYASSQGPEPVQSGYAVEVSTDETRTEQECEQWRSGQQQSSPPSAPATPDVQGRL